MQETHDTVVIGAGHAGLAMSRVLRHHGHEHVVLERGRIGERWRTERWDSLRFQFPNWTLQLPDYSYSGADPDGFAHFTDILATIENYARTTEAPVREFSEVADLAEDGERGGFAISLTEGTIRARQVVLATGPFQRPHVPRFAKDVASSSLQTDPTRYRNPDDLPAGAVLVVGSGASGCQIADELHRAGRPVFLSVSRHRRAPRRYLGRDFYYWLDEMGRFDQPIDTFPDRRWPPSTVVTGVDGGYDVDVRRLAAEGVRVIGRVADASTTTLRITQDANETLDHADQAYLDFVAAARRLALTRGEPSLDRRAERLTSGNAVEEVDSLDLVRENITAIIWATGYRYDYGWVHVPVFDSTGRPVQERGITGVPGLYFLGLHWMHTFRSGLFSGVGADAEHVAQHITTYASNPPRRRGHGVIMPS